MSFKTYSILWIVLFCFGFPSGVSGQYTQKETIGGKTYAVIYAEGLAGAAQWGSGVKMMRNGATIRHQVSKGNSGNLSVNDRIPFRFIVAPTDLNNPKPWSEAVGGKAGANQDLNAELEMKAGYNPDNPTGDTTDGCTFYGTTANGAGRKWRVPTQRELQLIWMFREAIGIIYPGAPMESASSKKYWAATEKDIANAWYFDFQTGFPACSWQLKTTASRVRCVSDY